MEANLGRRGHSYYVAQASLELEIILPPFAKCQDNQCMLPLLAKDESFVQWCWDGP